MEIETKQAQSRDQEETMPRVQSSIFDLSGTGPIIEYSAPNQKYVIAKDVILSTNHFLTITTAQDKSTLVNKGTVAGAIFTVNFFNAGEGYLENKSTGTIIGQIIGVNILETAVEMVNEGNIYSGNIGVLCNNAFSDFSLDNSGNIFAETLGVSVVLSGASRATISNSGVMEAGQGTFGTGLSLLTEARGEIVNEKGGRIIGAKDYEPIDEFDSPAGAITVSGPVKTQNKGVIIGDIYYFGSASNDKLINTGKIKGDVYLGDGNDVFKIKDKAEGTKKKKVFGDINGQDGNDKLVLGKQAETIVFDAALDAATNVDTVKKFEKDKDTFVLDQTIFTSLAVGALPASQLRKGTSAVDGDDYLVYDKPTGALYYDADGSGPEGQIQFAQLDPGTRLKATDFEIIA